MAPDIEELIKKVNTLTLDKNRLKQKLAQLSLSPTTSNQQANNNTHNNREANVSLNHSSSPSSINQQHFQFNSSPNSLEDGENFSKGFSNNNNDDKIRNSPKSKLTDDIRTSGNLINGVECSTSCEDDLLFMNDLYRKRLDEYNEKWDYIQSKCTALLSELNSLQKHYAILRREKLDLQERYDKKCDEFEQIEGELQTVVLNYETQLSAMSEHLSVITSQVSLNDNLDRIQQPPSSN